MNDVYLVLKKEKKKKKKIICDPTLHIPLSLSLSLSNDIMSENLVDIIATATHSSTPSITSNTITNHHFEPTSTSHLDRDKIKIIPKIKGEI